MSVPYSQVPDLAAILPEEVDPQVLTNFIEDAHVILDMQLGINGAGMPGARLTLIEKYLAAHLYTVTKGQGGLMSQKVGEATEVYAALDKTASGLGSTRFGQLVLSLDSSGLLASLGTTKKTAQFRLA